MAKRGPKPNPKARRDIRKLVRWSAKEYETLLRLAAKAGMRVGPYIRAKALGAPRGQS